MEDSETTTLDSMLMEEAMADTEKSSEDAVVGDGTDDTADESLGLAQEGELGDGVMDNEDVEMADGVAEDSENNNLAPEDSMDAPAALLEGEDESEEVSQEPLSTSEGLLGGQFISQTDSLIVQNEPPQQLMEEAEGEGDVADGELEGDGAIVAEADTTDEPTEALEKSEAGEELGEEALLLQQEGAELLQEEQDEPETVDLGALPEGMTLVSEHMEDEAEADAEAEGDADADADADADLTDDMIHGEGETADDQGETTDEAMELPPDDDDDDETENSAAAGITLLAGSELSEQALNDLEDKIAAVTDGTSVQLLPGQENLQGMQLMEGDDKPEDDTESAVQGQASQQEIQAQLNAALLKQEEMKIEEEDQPESGSFQEGQQNAEADALATLASAALDHQAPTNGVKAELDDQIKTESDSSEPQWMDVGICKGTHCQVRSFYVARPGQGWDQNWDGVTTSTLPDHRALAKLELESGKAYKFRVAAINSCGRGPWSEVAAFKTSLPGFPGAPSAIKIAKTADGAHLSWEPPPIASGVIEDYHVYLAVRTATTDSSKQVVSSGANQLAFVRIYQGAANQCSVGNDTLSKAHIDMTTKPAILFRISARNEKGIGPATQVRWLQEVGTPSNPARPAFAPRRPAADTKPHGNYKRKKSE